MKVRQANPLIWKLVIPATCVSFTLFTKWWYVLPVDAPDRVMKGFPLPYVCDGWHTSLSLQIFVSEFVIDLLCYFLFWFLVLTAVNLFVTKINPPKVLTSTLWTLSILFTVFFIMIACNPENKFLLKRDFDMKVMETGFKFILE